ncbi:MAG TPA: histidine kinase dimerization/phospho-acceptor domain-containing protein, partial [Chitinophagaceae bacterium]|nr:histidine kinase dimerization/phospho-acceptor domain-containing protein [Chitinophagaceae bacterium]
MRIWNIYIHHIKRNCASPEVAMPDMVYWRNNLFARTIIYLLPFCLIALIPGVYLSINTGKYILAVIDGMTVISIVMVAFLPGIALHIRKIIFIGSLYLLSCVLLYYIGLSGPGLLYLQLGCIFGILIFPAQYAWWPAFLNTFICILFAIAIFFGQLPWNDLKNPTSAWIAVSSNLVFLSFLSAALIPGLFNGLQQTLQKEKQLHQQLNKEQQSLSKAVLMLEQKNTELEQFAYAASHDLQEPLRMVTGFLTQLEKKYGSTFDDKAKQYIDFAVDGAQRMRQLILNLLEFSRVGRLG